MASLAHNELKNRLLKSYDYRSVSEESLGPMGKISRYLTKAKYDKILIMTQ